MKTTSGPDDAVNPEEKPKEEPIRPRITVPSKEGDALAAGGDGSGSDTDAPPKPSGQA